MDEELLRRARSYGTVARAYERGRPPFPRQAAAWLVGTTPVTVLEVGAGTGKLTEQLVALGHDVHATDPDRAMLDVLSDKLPDVRVSEAAAEELPAPDGSVDVVVAAQAFHWFDADRALAEFARVLRPGGHVALAWSSRDQRIPWVRRLGTVIGSQQQGPSSAEALVLSGLFGFVEEATFSFWHEIDRASIQDLVLSRADVASLDEEGRAAKLAEVLAFYDDYGRGMDGMRLPYDCRCYRAVVTEREDDRPPTDQHRGADAPTAATDEPDDGTHTDVLLIDFR